ncbi:hypothetical protein EG68_10362 [Paragonimus skrjabini miyazakii]|uniref:Protein MAK10 homolog n=1 Tax=Paragonimus skrjabini miyazakii TaxID=59628 RepID=A0A8S9YCG5_9TREM|nr:hypothetical protein EG68_10362 [Paragonimus skrjabini miyazakii]
MEDSTSDITLVAPPDSHSESADVIDITDRFVTACQRALRPGELCFSPLFTLQHAMSAIEIMDPKMDIRVPGARRIVSTAESLATKALPLGPFENLGELVGIMDEMLCSLVNWLTGDSLAQSVFISMYMDCTQLVRDPYLVIFCKLLRRSVCHLREFILKTNVTDEEDHYVPTHGVPLSEPNPAYDRLLEVGQCSKSLGYPSEDITAQAQDLINGLSEGPDATDNELSSCLSTRLSFIKHLFLFVESLFNFFECQHGLELFNQDDLTHEADYVSLSSDKKQDCVQLSSNSPILDFTMFWTKLYAISSDCQVHLKTLAELSRRLLSTISAGSPSGLGRIAPKDSPYGLPGFEPFLNQNKLPSYIPRLVIIHDRLASFTYLQKLTSHLLNLTSTLQNMAEIQLGNQSSASSPHAFWCILRSNGQIPCEYMAELLHGSKEPSFKSTLFNLTSCVLSRTLIYSLYMVSMGRLHHWIENVPVQAQFALRSWLLLEPKNYRPLLNAIVSEVVGLDTFFDILGEQLSQIPRLYSLNRSRQRSALEQCLQKFPDFLEECLRMEWIVGLELTKKLNGVNPVDPPDVTVKPHPLQLTSFVCYYYYLLAWDYIASGFQLDLYSSCEWIFMYAFIIQLLQQLSSLLERFVMQATTNGIFIEEDGPSIETNGPECSLQASITVKGCRETDLVDHSGANTKPDSSDSGLKKGRKKSRRHNQSKQTKQTASPRKTRDTKASNCFSLLQFCGPQSQIELLTLTVHRFLTAATMYALRALQLDSGGDPVLDVKATNLRVGYGNPVEMYGRRLGIFVCSANSPLMEPGGVQGSFDSCRQYLTTGSFCTSTDELYACAAHNFENARFRAQLATSQLQHALLTLSSSNKTDKTRFPERFMQQLFGTPDPLDDLCRLANHNTIACRVLASCPDRRPKPISLDATTSFSRLAQKSAFLLSSSPVKLEFDYLASRTYPLIRLVSPQTRVAS